MHWVEVIRDRMGSKKYRRIQRKVSHLCDFVGRFCRSIKLFDHFETCQSMKKKTLRARTRENDVPQHSFLPFMQIYRRRCAVWQVGLNESYLVQLEEMVENDWRNPLCK